MGWTGLGNIHLLACLLASLPAQSLTSPQYWVGAGLGGLGVVNAGLHALAQPAVGEGKIHGRLLAGNTPDLSKACLALGKATSFQ